MNKEEEALFKALKLSLAEAEIRDINTIHCTKKNIKDIIKLIDKQQEENEKYIAKNLSLKYAMDNMIHKDIVRKNYISKDKIKVKI